MKHGSTAWLGTTDSLGFEFLFEANSLAEYAAKFIGSLGLMIRSRIRSCSDENALGRMLEAAVPRLSLESRLSPAAPCHIRADQQLDFRAYLS